MAEPVPAETKMIIYLDKDGVVLLATNEKGVKGTFEKTPFKEPFTKKVYHVTNMSLCYVFVHTGSPTCITYYYPWGAWTVCY